MSSFRYRALALDGRELSGEIVAETPRQARSLLREQGLTPLSVESPLANPAGHSRQAGLRSSERVILTRQWATLLEAGIPIGQTLAVLIEQSSEPRLRFVLGEVREALLAGQSLSRALASHTSAFDTLYCALIAAGEQSGRLGEVMNRLADHLEKRSALRQRIIQALAYPLVVVLVASLVIAALMVYVVPQVVAVFQNGKQTLPWLTQALIACSSFLRAAWPGLLLAGAAAIWGFRRLSLLPAWRLRWHRQLLRLPFVGALLLGFDSARLAQTLAILVGSGVPLLPALQAAREVVWLLPCRLALERIAEQVREGMTLGRALAEARLFPPMLVHMVGSGESSGRLGQMLDKTASQQAEEVGNRLSLSMSLLEPMLILGMGVFVLVIVLAILQPILEINQLLR